MRKARLLKFERSGVSPDKAKNEYEDIAEEKIAQLKHSMMNETTAEELFFFTCSLE